MTRHFVQIETGSNVYRFYGLGEWKIREGQNWRTINAIYVPGEVLRIAASQCTIKWDDGIERISVKGTDMITEHEPGGFRDRCSRCGGWISLGHAEGSSCRLSLECDGEDDEAIEKGDAGPGDGEVTRE